MSTKNNEHGGEHLDLLFLYVLQSLPASEVLAVEKQISECDECRHELASLRATMGSFVFWPTDVLRPPASLWARVAKRIEAGTGVSMSVEHSTEVDKFEWEEVAPGISCKLLATDQVNDRVSMLVRLAPGTDYPAHSHAGVEELHLLHGELMVDNKTLYPGDFIHAEPGTVDHRVWSETGCTCVLITSTKDSIL